jgi:hypothetical protein
VKKKDFINSVISLALLAGIIFVLFWIPSLRQPKTPKMNKTFFNVNNDKWINYDLGNICSDYNPETINWITEKIVEVIVKKDIISSEFNDKFKDKLIYRGVPSEKAEKVARCISSYVIDIENKKYKILKETFYDDNGNIICSYKKTTPFKIIIQDSKEEHLWQEMRKWQTVKILKELVNIHPENPIYFYLLGEKYNSIINPFPFSFCRNSLITEYYRKAVENSISIETFPFEMVKVKNVNLKKEDLFKILKSHFIYSFLTLFDNTPKENERDEYIKILEDTTNWWRTKLKEIPPRLEISVRIDQLPEEDRKIIIGLDLFLEELGWIYMNKNDINKSCKYFYKEGLLLLAMYEDVDDVIDEMSMIIKMIKDKNSSSPYIEALEKKLKEECSKNTEWQHS